MSYASANRRQIATDYPAWPQTPWAVPEPSFPSTWAPPYTLPDPEQVRRNREMWTDIFVGVATVAVVVGGAVLLGKALR